MPERPSVTAESFIAHAHAATAELRALAATAARALAPLGLSADWQATAAAVPLLAAKTIGIAEARRLLGPGHYTLAAHVAALPDPRLAAREAVEGEDPAQAERLRRLFLGLIRDLRAVPLVLAVALARLEMLREAPAAERTAAAREAFLLYAPLANRLGIWQLKWPLEDLAFRFSEPERYTEIAHSLAERRSAREARLEGARAELAGALATIPIAAQISGRPKHIYSIWRKMQQKGRTLEELYDLMGLRIIVGNVGDCYAALGVVHERWRYLPHEFDDYIAAPKGNFYRSLHTAVLDDSGRALEIQIRTEAMHREAELGVAAHWRYKEGGARDQALEESLAWLRQLLAAEDETASFAQTVTAELASERIYALSPRGRVIDLPLGATPLDFAYAIHSGLGHRSAGARVNGRLVPLTHRLATGDTVEIMTRRTARPSRDWLRPEAGYVTTRRARQKLRAWFRATDAASDAPTEAPKEAPPVSPPSPVPRRGRQRTKAKQAVVSAMPELPAELARCCMPRPEQPIAAFVTRGHGIRLHRQDCASFRRNAARAPRQTLAAHWE